MRIGARGSALWGKVPTALRRPPNRSALAVVLIVVAALATPPAAPLDAQTIPSATDHGTAGPRALSLAEALRLALGASEAVAIAHGGVTDARGQRITARAGWLPQIVVSYYYTHTLASQFSQLERGRGLFPDSTRPAPPCSAFGFDPALSLEERVDRLEEAVGCAPTTPGAGSAAALNFGEFGFGQRNTHGFGFSLFQPVYLGGQIRAQKEAADAASRSADLEVTTQNAQLVVTVTEAYYDALLGARLLAIAEESLAHAEETLRFTELAFQAGEQAEYDVLRARVARDLQRNNVLQQRSNRDLTFFHLKQQLDLPADEPVVLSTSLSAALADAVILPDWARSAPDTATALRAGVRQAEQAVKIQGAGVELARAQGRPTLALTTDYGLISFPENVLVIPTDFRNNWTVGFQVSYPLFSGGRVRGNVVQARGSLEQAEARLRETRKAAALDTRTRLEAMATARATLDATAGTVEEARRALEIAQLRFEQDLANLTEVGDARLMLSQAEADRAQALRNLYVAQVQLLLIQDLPISGAPAPGGRAPAPGTPATGTSATGVAPLSTPRTGVPSTGIPPAGGLPGGLPGGRGVPRTGSPGTPGSPATRGPQRSRGAVRDSTGRVPGPGPAPVLRPAGEPDTR